MKPPRNFPPSHGDQRPQRSGHIGQTGQGGQAPQRRYSTNMQHRSAQFTQAPGVSAHTPSAPDRGSALFPRTPRPNAGPVSNSNPSRTTSSTGAQTPRNSGTAPMQRPQGGSRFDTGRSRANHSNNPNSQSIQKEGGARTGGDRDRGGKKAGSGGFNRNRRSRPSSQPMPAPKALTPVPAGESSLGIPPPGDDVRVITFGGVEEIGRNMTAIEHNGDIVVIDAGLQFKELETPGIDYILPNTKYLEERRDKIRAIFITHGHLDHIGGIPYLMDKLGNPPMYARNLTALMIKKRQEEFPHMQPLDMRIVEKDETVKAGGLNVSFFSVTHTIPDSMGIVVETTHGSVVYTGDLKLDHTDGIPSEREEVEFGKFANKKILLLMADSTNVERPGFSIPEHVVIKNIEKIIRETSGRLIIGTFASQLERIVQIIGYAEQLGKKIVIEGRSMKINVEIAKLANILKVKKDTLITTEEMDGLPPHKIVVLATGAQGDEYAALMRMANKSHKQLKITTNDTVVLSSSIIPGNERGVQKLKDNLSRQGAKIIHYQVSDVHSSGHANHDESLWIHKKVAARFFIPIHGYHYMLRVHADIAHAAGLPYANVVIPDNGMIMDIVNKGEKITVRKETAPKSLVMVDGFAVGDIQDVVIRDRQMLSQDGMFVIIATLDTTSGKVKKSPDIISRGFVYLRESQELLRQTRFIIKQTIEENTAAGQQVNFDFIKNVVTDNVSRYLFQQTNKRPIVIPVILGV